VTDCTYFGIYFTVMDSISFGDIYSMLPISGALWVVCVISALVFAVHSGILFWHWKLYSTGKFTTMGNMLLYLSVGIGLLFVMTASILWYSLTV